MTTTRQQAGEPAQAGDRGLGPAAPVPASLAFPGGAPAAAAWEQYVYGKLAASERGPVQPGCEHDCTGRSAGFPAELAAWCHPRATGLGMAPETPWESYLWLRSGGGFVVRPCNAGDIGWVLAARICGRPERGEGIPGRYYTQAHYAAVRPEGFSPAALSVLRGRLPAVPMRAADTRLPSIDAGAVVLDEPLPADWMERIAPVLRAILSGQCYHETAAGPEAAALEEFVKFAAVCLSALPAALAWRVPLGAGVVTADESIALALTQIPGPRRAAPPAAAAGAQRYASWLERVAGGSRTPGELRRRVAEAMPEMSAPLACPARQTWREVAAAVMRRVIEREADEAAGAWLLSLVPEGPGAGGTSGALALTRMDDSPQLARRAIEAAAAGCDPERLAALGRLIERWAGRVEPSRVSPMPVLAALVTFVRHEPAMRFAELEGPDLETLRSAMTRLGRQADVHWLFLNGREEADLALASRLLVAGRVPPLEGERLARLLERVAAEPGRRRFWERTVLRLGAIGSPGWRLLAGPVSAAAIAELGALRLVSGRALLHLVLRGDRIEPALLRRIGQAELEEALPIGRHGLEGASRLARLAAGCPELGRGLAGWALRGARLGGAGGLELEELLERHPARRGLLDRMLPSLGGRERDPYLVLAGELLSRLPERVAEELTRNASAAGAA